MADYAAYPGGDPVVPVTDAPKTLGAHLTQSDDRSAAERSIRNAAEPAIRLNDIPSVTAQTLRARVPGLPGGRFDGVPG